MALTKAQLSSMKCQNPTCDHADCQELYLHASCHYKAALTVRYHKEKGVVALFCDECGAYVVSLALKER